MQQQLQALQTTQQSEVDMQVVIGTYKALKDYEQKLAAHRKIVLLR
jgi:hypothetical protein